MTFLPDDDACQSAGEGITRTSEPGAIHWPCEITFACRQPMRCTIRASCSNTTTPATMPNRHSTRAITARRPAAAWAAA